MSFCSNYFVFKDKVIANHHYRDVLIDDLPLQLASVGGDIVILALSLEVRVLGGDSETDDVIPGAAVEELVVIEYANKEDKIVSEKIAPLARQYICQEVVDIEESPNFKLEVNA